jgi:hypothetical protein
MFQWCCVVRCKCKSRCCVRGANDQCTEMLADAAQPGRTRRTCRSPKCSCVRYRYTNDQAQKPCPLPTIERTLSRCEKRSVMETSVVAFGDGRNSELTHKISEKTEKHRDGRIWQWSSRFGCGNVRGLPQPRPSLAPPARHVDTGSHLHADLVMWRPANWVNHVAGRRARRAVALPDQG